MKWMVVHWGPRIEVRPSRVLRARSPLIWGSWGGVDGTRAETAARGKWGDKTECPADKTLTRCRSRACDGHKAARTYQTARR